MSLEELERRIQVLEDVEAIKKFKARYADVCDNGYIPDEMVKLFTEDATWENLNVEGSRLTGREALREHYREVQNQITFAVHYFLQPQIEVEGNEGQGRWCFLSPQTEASGKKLWVAGIENERYRKVDGNWLLSEIKIKFFFKAPYEEGW